MRLATDLRCLPVAKNPKKSAESPPAIAKRDGIDPKKGLPERGQSRESALLLLKEFEIHDAITGRALEWLRKSVGIVGLTGMASTALMWWTD